MLYVVVGAGTVATIVAAAFKQVVAGVLHL
jgi:hypothetical protein